jgi:hypothetical protein
MAITALALHRVADYAAWRRVYDSVEEQRRQGGVTGTEVLRPTNGDSVVAVTHDFETEGEARAFFANEELKSAMAQAGVDLSSFQLHLLERD